jgi:hypothetical protein
MDDDEIRDRVGCYDMVIAQLQQDVAQLKATITEMKSIQDLAEKKYIDNVDDETKSYDADVVSVQEATSLKTPGKKKNAKASCTKATKECANTVTCADSPAAGAAAIVSVVDGADGAEEKIDDVVKAVPKAPILKKVKKSKVVKLEKDTVAIDDSVGETDGACETRACKIPKLTKAKTPAKCRSKSVKPVKVEDEAHD